MFQCFGNVGTVRVQQRLLSALAVSHSFYRPNEYRVVGNLHFLRDSVQSPFTFRSVFWNAGAVVDAMGRCTVPELHIKSPELDV